MDETGSTDASHRLEEWSAGFSRSASEHAQKLIAVFLEEFPQAGEELRVLAATVRDLWQDEDHTAIAPPSASALLQGVKAWLDRHHLSSSVLFLTIGATVEAWMKNPEETRIAPAGVIRMQQPVPEPPIYRPESMTREQYIAAIREYMPVAEAAWHASAAAAGEELVRVRAPRARDPADPFRHYRWLARYQEGTPRARIAKDFDVEPNAVRDAIAQLAEALKLKLREQPMGRPRRAAD